MKKLYLMILVLAVLVASGTTAAWAGKQEVCHFPPGNPANFHTITVSDNAVDAHLTNHDDLLGSCLANCEAICDDGNACTIDVVPDPDRCICAPEPRAQVDCSDGNACTADSCDSVSGSCINDPGPLNGAVCDDDNSNTTGETCSNGSCDPPCPCFTGADLVANGTVAVCGSNFPGFPNLTGMIWTNGAIACSGELCAVGTPGVLSCIISSLGNPQFVTGQEDQNCRALILNYCSNPNLTQGLTGEPSETPFIIQ
ncbi:MAG: hypothetical protein KDD47_20750 [Acidobacteria bacterium]|nr:hypothetical protein [Acidobacteriota bacterium]